jgi:hypothetical protein
MPPPKGALSAKRCASLELSLAAQAAKTDWAQLYFCEKSSKARLDPLIFALDLRKLIYLKISIFALFLFSCAASSGNATP